MSGAEQKIFIDLYERGVENGVTSLTDFASGAWSGGRSALTDKVVADQVEKAAAAVAVGRFLRSEAKSQARPE